MGWVWGRLDEVLGADETVEAGGGEDEGAEDLDIFPGGDFGVGFFEDAADVDAEHVDLVVEAGGIGFLEVFDFGAIEMAGIEAVFEGVFVAEGSAGAVLGGGGFGGHEGVPFAG